MEDYSHQGKKTSVPDETEDNDLTRDKVCKMIGFSYSNINKLKIIKDFNPDLLKMIDDGKKTINKVFKMCGKKKKKDSELIDYDHLTVPKSKLFKGRHL